MRLRITGIVLAACVIAGGRPARAEGFITPFLGFNFGGDSANCISLTNCQEKRTNFGVSIGTLSGLGFEEDISFAKNFFGDVTGADNSVFTAMSNLLISIPAGPVRPYVVGGIGLIRPHVSTTLAGLTSFEKNAFGYDLGGGVHVILGHVGVRGDLRRVKTVQDIPLVTLTNEKLVYWRGSAGLTLAF